MACDIWKGCCIVSPAFSFFASECRRALRGVVANPNLLVVLLKRDATVMSMGAARTWLEIFCISICIFCKMNEDMDSLLCRKLHLSAD